MRFHRAGVEFTLALSPLSYAEQAPVLAGEASLANDDALCVWRAWVYPDYVTSCMPVPVHASHALIVLPTPQPIRRRYRCWRRRDHRQGSGSWRAAEDTAAMGSGGSETLLERPSMRGR